MLAMEVATVKNRNKKSESVVIFAEVSPELKAWLEAQAIANRRSLTSELKVVLENSLDPAHKPKTKKREGVLK